ncbi:MAG: hypothetical protein CMM61_15240 [Rhodospirillaceae bacterium]|nr:hypothetical protein [Rhodospirillaceae bacterium]
MGVSIRADGRCRTGPHSQDSKTKRRPSPQDLIDILGDLTSAKDYMDWIAAERARKERIDQDIEALRKVIQAEKKKLEKLRVNEEKLRGSLAIYEERLRVCEEGRQ